MMSSFLNRFFTSSYALTRYDSIQINQRLQLPQWRLNNRNESVRSFSTYSNRAFRFNLQATIGVRCIVGARPYQEDRFGYTSIQHPEGHYLYYFAVFDGHAGESSADYLANNLHHHFSNTLCETYRLLSLNPDFQIDPSIPRSDALQSLFALDSSSSSSLLDSSSLSSSTSSLLDSSSSSSLLDSSSSPDAGSAPSEPISTLSSSPSPFTPSSPALINPPLYASPSTPCSFSSPLLPPPPLFVSCPFSTQDILQHSFAVADRELERASTEQRWRSGSTASVLVVDLHRGELVTGQLGDSKIVLCEEGRAVRLTPEHTPHKQAERRRIEAAGGSVVVGPDGVPRMGGLLSMSRAFGDFALRDYGLSAEPSMGTRRIEAANDAFCVLGTDGLFGVVSSQEAVDLVKTARSPEHAAELLVDEAELKGTTDNTTAMVVPLYAWGKHRDQNFTTLLATSGFDTVFGSKIAELPASLSGLLSTGKTGQGDIVTHLWSIFDEDRNETLTATEVDHGLAKLGISLPDEDIELIVSVASGTSKGAITKEEFLAQFPNRAK